MIIKVKNSGGWNDTYLALCCLIGKNGKDFITYWVLERLSYIVGEKSDYRGAN